MTLYCIHTQNLPILEQLHLEETLLRSSKENFCIINEGTPEKTVVMGLSGIAQELVDLEKTQRDQIPIIRRFTGGGTVIVDELTLFISFIFNKDAHSFDLFPKEIMYWSHTIYEKAFSVPLLLRENDYVIGEKKCGGNAQYISKERFIHHTSFLWDFKKESMSYLLQPKKAPAYREGRSHLDFLCTLQTLFSSKKEFLDKFKHHLSTLYTFQEQDIELFLKEKLPKEQLRSKFFY